REQGLPVQRLRHNKLGSVFARADELDAWVRSRVMPLAESSGPRAVARSAKPSATPQHSGDPEAHRLYLMSRAQWDVQTVDGMAQSLELARLAVARDKDYALAHAMVAICLMPRATYVPQAPAPLMEAARASAIDALM